jgi:hypothetical protein
MTLRGVLRTSETDCDVARVMVDVRLLLLEEDAA